MANISQMADTGDLFCKSIIAGIEKEVTRLADEAIEANKEAIAKEIEDIQRDVVARVALRISKHTSVEYMRDRLVIEILDRRE